MRLSYVANDLLPEGIYEFKVTAAEDKESKSGWPMIVLTMNVWNKLTPESSIKDWLVSIAPGKIKQFCQVTNQMDVYKSEGLGTENCTGKMGHLEIIIKDDNQGEERNFVRRYIASDKLPAVNSLPEPNDEIPF